MSTALTKPATPGTIWDVVHGFTAYWSVVAAVRLGVFELLAAGPLPITDLAAGCGADAGRLEIALDALVALGLLEEEGTGYVLSSVSATFLVPGRDRYMGDLVVRSPGVTENWPALHETVRGRRPPAQVDDDLGSFRAGLVPATFPTQYAAAGRTAELLALGEPRAVLDIGTGAAPWGIALLEAWPDAVATLSDFEEVLHAARQRAAEHGVLDRCRLLPGDYRDVELPDGTFDVAVLAHVARSEGLEGAPLLIARTARALRDGGRLLLVDYFLDDDRRGPLQALLLGVTMVANTQRGSTFTHAQFRGWLEAAGLVDIELLEPIPFTQVFVATKPHTEGG